MAKCTLNQSFMESVQCQTGKRKDTFFDKNITGFALEVRVTGGKTWYLYYYDTRGVKRQVRIGDAKYVPYELAKKTAFKMKQKVDMGENPVLEKKMIRQIPTVKEFVEQQFLPHIKASKRAWPADWSYLTNHILPKIGNKPMDLVNRTDIVNIHHGLRERDYAMGTCNRILILLRYIFNCAIRWGVQGLVKNPCKDVEKFADDAQKERYLVGPAKKTILL